LGIKISSESHKKLSKLEVVLSLWFVSRDYRAAPPLPPDAFLQIRASQSLLSIIHSVKLLLLLSDKAQMANRRYMKLKSIHAEKDDVKRKVA